MPQYLLEIGTEELPADFVVEAQDRLKSLLTESLQKESLSFEEIQVLGTPRRLTCIINGLAEWQPAAQKKVKGPPVKSSFDAQGKPSPAATGFAQKQGLKLEELQQEEIAGVVYLVANLNIAGQKAAVVLQKIAPEVISAISGERLMRWGAADFKFSRPIRWMVSLLDKEELPISVAGLTSGRDSQGHRILAPGKVSISSPASYVDDLRKACVLVCPKERQEVIEKEIVQAAHKVDGQPRKMTGPLLQEVVNITEWPSAVLGEFAQEYLDLPDTLIETVMVHHQRYFPVESKADASGKVRLLPYFISVANNDRATSKPVVKRGNERVLKARLADGRFFYFDDRKTQLSQRKEALCQLTFHEGLGSYQDKQERLVKCARTVADELKLDARLAVCLERTLELCKLDLVTNLVRELPELQGYVGSWYAEQEGQPPDVVAAITSHYAPRSTEDAIPTDMVGRFSSLLDKLDNLVSVFAVGKRPSGSSDPYILRRQAQGVIDIVVDGMSQYPINLTKTMELLAELLQPWLARHKGKVDAQAGLRDLREFLLQRLKLKLIDKGFRREIIEAVMASGDSLANLPDVLVRCQALEEFSANSDGLDLIRAGIRVGNILGADSPRQVKPELLQEAAEKQLWDAFQKEVVKPWTGGKQFVPPNTNPPKNKEDYLKLLKLLSSIAAGVDKFFTDVMVNDPDKAKRDNRHGLLFQIDEYFKTVADFPKLQPLLP